jgi:hypothetical protein
MAAKAATLALVHDPRMTKARFRRGLARKEMNQFTAARIGKNMPSAFVYLLPFILSP